MISDKTYKNIMNFCNFTSENSSKKCDESVSYAVNHEFGQIDQYSIYTPSCRIVQNETNYLNNNVRFKNTIIHRKLSGYDPCTENYAEEYFNRHDVQRAMHANVTGISYKWTACRYSLSLVLAMYTCLGDWDRVRILSFFEFLLGFGQIVYMY